ncbi:hypothetical protein M0802_007278 [Mischocyttarus mexicanus]|nr:hypothetical protein M0802_007278 [Mischocyttarus mexicanus]
MVTSVSSFLVFRLAMLERKTNVPDVFLIASKRNHVWVRSFPHKIDDCRVGKEKKRVEFDKGDGGSGGGGGGGGRLSR